MSADRTFHVVEAVVGDGGRASLRRRWSSDFKERAVAAALEPGVNVSALARKLGVAPAQVFGWRRQALAKGAAVGDPALSGSAVVTGAADRRGIEIAMCGAVIRVGPDVGEAELARVLRAVRRS